MPPPPSTAARCTTELQPSCADLSRGSKPFTWSPAASSAPTRRSSISVSCRYEFSRVAQPLPQPRRHTSSASSCLAGSPIFEPPACFDPFHLVWTSLLAKRDLADCVVRRDRQSGIDIDMIRVIRRDSRSSIVLVFPPAPVGAQSASVQLSAEAKHLRDFRKYNPKTFDGSMDSPTKAQMWLTSIEKIFRYMKCPEDQKVQCTVSFLQDRGTAWWETAERMLGGDVNKITWEQFKESFYAKFFFANVKYPKQ
ncbi:gag-protease polyprotein [Cucumis melo var. makuwa]|uniref:Gag-protease polyprotein n=1 Tax=Cucumis melo var. makuwa TaxID=1194695 RepID=A0A5D3CTM8_CUCMM|nr:gag-protease polyprotein [Cucumis melo var. makuwa]TYK15211.1 gag-protease polyprotein [Cucumis melo var. makuwa]